MSSNIVENYTDRCLSNFLVKTSTGLGIGILSSVILFKRRTWPLQLFTGFGAGWAYADCDRLFNPYALPGVTFKKEEPQQQN